MKKQLTCLILFAFSMFLTSKLLGQPLPSNKHTDENLKQQFKCGLDEKGIDALNAHKEKAIIRKFGSIERWKAERKLSKSTQAQSRAATCDLKVEIVKLGTASNITATSVNTYKAELSETGGEFAHATNVVVVANSVVMTDLYTLFPTALSYVPTAGTAGEYYIQSEDAIVEDLPLWTGYASNQTNQTIVVVPLTWAGPNGTKPIRIILGTTPVGGVNPIGFTDGSDPALDRDKSNFHHGFMLVTGTIPGFLLIHETGHGLGFNHDNSMPNYMGIGGSTATQFIPTHRIIGDISLQMAGTSGTNGSNGLGYFTSQCNATTLPVELLDFTGKLDKNGKISLNWHTADEQNTEGFDVEQSNDGKTFIKIGTSKARGSNSTYFFTDEQENLNTIYYRLKINDFDGRISYSKVLSFNAQNASKVRIYPTYTEGSLFMENVKTFEVVNPLGQIVSTVSNIQNLPSGMYFVRGIDTNGAFFTQKVFKN
jgi:hypothetical protein